MRYQLLIMLLSIQVFASANVIRIGSNQPHKTVKAGIAAAAPGDTVIIGNGVYYENFVNVTLPLTITGEPGAIVDGGNKGQIFDIVADNVTLQNLTIRNVGVSHTNDFSAVRVANCQNFHLQNLIIRDVFFGIYLAKVNRGTILHCDIASKAVNEYDSGNGIHLWYAKNVLIQGNKIVGTRDGIYFEFADSCMIRNNYSAQNIRYGLHFMFSNNDEYVNNIFEDNGAGVAVMYSRRINMSKNDFRFNWGTASFGLLLKEIYEAEIEDNLFNQNSIGIQIESSTDIKYRNNKFFRNGWAIRFLGAAYRNEFTDNDFMSNSFDVSYNGNVNDNKFVNNYWSEYTGYDLNRDRIGDIPYRPVNLFGFIVGKTPEAVILLRSLFIALINFSEKVSPIFTPVNLTDPQPKMFPNA